MALGAKWGEGSEAGNRERLPLFLLTLSLTHSGKTAIASFGLITAERDRMR